MRIDNGQGAPLQNANAVRKEDLRTEPKRDRTKPAVSGDDEVKLSAVTKGDGGASEASLAQLRLEVQSGEYVVPSGELSKAIIREHLQG